jgi:hypothetical protein
MKKILAVTLLFILLLSKLIIVGLDSIKTIKLMGLSFVELMSFSENIGLILEPALILLSLCGLLMKSVKGWIITLIYPFGIIMWHVMLAINSKVEMIYFIQTPQLHFLYILIVLLNLPITKQYFLVENFRKGMFGILVSAFLGSSIGIFGFLYKNYKFFN